EEEEECWINVDTLKRQQQMDILRKFASNVQVAQRLISPSELILHPSETFEILHEISKKELIDEVVLWIFLHRSVDIIHFTDAGEMRFLWPRWTKLFYKD